MGTKDHKGNGTDCGANPNQKVSYISSMATQKPVPSTATTIHTKMNTATTATLGTRTKNEAKTRKIEDLDERIAKKTNGIAAMNNQMLQSTIAPTATVKTSFDKAKTKKEASTSTLSSVELLDERIAHKTNYFTPLPSPPSSAASIPSSPTDGNFQEKEHQEEDEDGATLPEISQQQEQAQYESSQHNHHQHHHRGSNDIDHLYPITAIATLVPEEDEGNDLENGTPQKDKRSRKVQIGLCVVFCLIVGMAVTIGVLVNGSNTSNNDNKSAINDRKASPPQPMLPPPPQTAPPLPLSPPPQTAPPLPLSPPPQTAPPLSPPPTVPPPPQSDGSNNDPKLEWTPSASKLINIISPNNSLSFGRTLSTNFDGTMIATSFIDSSSSEGVVQVYQINDGSNVDRNWIPLGQALHDGDLPEYGYGQFVALSSGYSGSTTPPRLAVGERICAKNDGNGAAAGGGGIKTEVGRVHVYELSSNPSTNNDDPMPTNKWIKLGEPIEGKNQWETFGSPILFSKDGSVLAAGAPDPQRAGVVRLYRWVLSSLSTRTLEEKEEGGNEINGKWIQWGEDIVGDDVGDHLAKVALSEDGRIVAVGAREAKGKGRVRVYEMKVIPPQDDEIEEKQEWKQIGQDLMGEENNDKFGWSISLSHDGKTLAVSGRRHDGGVDGSIKKNSGHVKVFRYITKKINNSSGLEEDIHKWIPVGNDIDGEHAGDSSGDSISLSSDGRTIAIGAFRNYGEEEEQKIDSGHVRVFRYDDGIFDWVQVGRDVDGENAGDEFGRVVKLSDDGTRFVAGAPGEENGVGSVYVFDLKTEED